MFWPSALTLVLVLWLTLSPDPAPDMVVPSFLGKYADKLIHAIMMGGLCGAVIFDMKRHGENVPRQLSLRFYVWLCVCMLFFSAADELVQGAMGMGRSADVYDFCADAVGIFIALLLAPSVCDRVIRHKV